MIEQCNKAIQAVQAGRRLFRPARRLVLGGVLILATWVTPLSADAVFQQQNREKVEELRDDLRQLVISARDRVFPSLVNIRVTTSRHINGKEEKGHSVGSGTIISSEGYVLTNFHVRCAYRSLRSHTSPSEIVV